MSHLSKVLVFVDPEFDNHQFYSKWLKELNFQEQQIHNVKPDFVQNLPITWFPVIAFADVSSELDFLSTRLEYQGDKYHVLDSKYTFHNRVLFREVFISDPLIIFSQENCLACERIKLKLTRQQIEFKIATKRDPLWHEMNIRHTPSFLWKGRYFFERPEGFKITHLKNILPSTGLLADQT